jgi:murein L,D-transpeptidase YcbB/YkuD
MNGSTRNWLLWISILLLQLGSMKSVCGQVDEQKENSFDLHRQFELLEKAEKEYAGLIQRLGNWTKVNGTKKSIRLGDSSLAVVQLRKRLYESGDMAMSEGVVFDEEVEKGLQRFQRRHGLVDDGVLGRQTLVELNVSLEKRYEQILVNLERSKSYLTGKGTPHVVINIPDYRLYAQFGPSRFFSSKVVVGKETNMTVVFNAEIRQVVFAPYWYVPESIMLKEILPELSRDPAYLEKNEMEWFDGKIRQKPGDLNALGKVKFLFPNPHNIYLHDTPAKSLFKENKRTFSHGCIRLEDPRKMAVYLLRDREGWTEQAVDEALASKTEKTIALKNPIHIHIVYFTAYVLEGGQLHFNRDIYKRD